MYPKTSRVKLKTQGHICLFDRVLKRSCLERCYSTMCSHLFSAFDFSSLSLLSSALPLGKLCLPLLPSVGRPVDAAWYSFTFISAAHEPDMIYALPLTSLSPFSSLSTLTPFLLLLCTSLLRLLLYIIPRLHPSSSRVQTLTLFALLTLPSLQSSLSNGDKGRPTDYLSNGKKRKAEEKEFMTDYVRTLS